MKFIINLTAFFFLLTTYYVPAQPSPPGEKPWATWTEEKNTVYGAKPNHVGPIGGGRNYQRILTKGNYTVSTIAELQTALSQASAEETIFIDGDAEIDLTHLIFSEKYSIRIPSGVTLASDRGHHKSEGAIIRSLSFATPGLIHAMGPNVRITGLRIEGPDKERRLDHYSRSFEGLSSKERKNRVWREHFYKFPNSRGIVTRYDSMEIDNCQLWGWSHAAVFLKKGKGHYIHHNYIHHNQRKALGYGIVHHTAFSLIEYNLFNYNRHSIAGTGKPPSGYEARHNVELGASLSHCFDMHGGRDRGDGTKIAGSQIIISNNTFLTPTRAIAIRGIPKFGCEITRNLFYQKEIGREVFADWPPAENIKIWDNKFNSIKVLKQERKEE